MAAVNITRKCNYSALPRPQRSNFQERNRKIDANQLIKNIVSFTRASPLTFYYLSHPVSFGGKKESPSRFNNDLKGHSKCHSGLCLPSFFTVCSTRKTKIFFSFPP
ncbi:hypothetical protein CEXT_226771 [Caerostris extrusa]|uniref:Uncharacterized protein n=1 Tax=Caerostris extrusa TaxID=172846 RepID=A0AAV4PAC9_CAEEX|nr:hypothetical protein CEXT_226771 [Caerostris extrusa]